MMRRTFRSAIDREPCEIFIFIPEFVADLEIPVKIWPRGLLCIVLSTLTCESIATIVRVLPRFADLFQ